MSNFSVVFYETEMGDRPAQEFLDSLDPKMFARTARAVEMLAVNGNNLREPYSKPVEDGIFELRTQAGNDISRVLFFFFTGKKIVLTNGFIKKTQKTPKAEVEKAKKYRSDFLKRERNKE